MKEKIMELKLMLDREIELSEELKLKRKQFEAQNENLFQRISSMSNKITELKETITDETKIEFEKDGIKKRYGGLGIRIMNEVSYDDKVALGWAKEHSLCLKLDASAFKKIAKTQDINFVTKVERVLVTFPAEIKLDGE